MARLPRDRRMFERLPKCWRNGYAARFRDLATLSKRSSVRVVADEKHQGGSLQIGLGVHLGERRWFRSIADGTVQYSA